MGKKISNIIVIGNFDGVHAGHRHVLGVAKNVADQENMPIIVLTFEPHPRQVFQPEKPFKRLMNLDQKKAALQAQGVDDVEVQPFDLEFAKTTPEDFIQKLLIEKLKAKHIVVGENFRFGYKAAGDIATLQAEKRLTTHAVPLLKDTHGVVSSSRLREVEED